MNTLELPLNSKKKIVLSRYASAIIVEVHVINTRNAHAWAVSEQLVIDDEQARALLTGLSELLVSSQPELSNSL